MFKLHVVQAQFGDSLIIEHGTSAKPRYLLIDGGPPQNFQDDLNHALTSIVTTKKLDAAILSHVDMDHVAGLLDLFAALEDDQANNRPLRVKMDGLWHNSFQRAIDTTGEITQRMQVLVATAGTAGVAMPLTADAFFGVKEGHKLRILATKLKVPINKNFTDDLVMLETATEPRKFGKLSLRVVGPNQANLDALRDDWLKWLAKTEQNLTATPNFLANADESVPNLSSIVLLAECEGKTLLLTGDARSDHIQSGLEQAGLLSSGKFHIDVMKVAHHGSDRNGTAKFFKNVTADTYVISANGKHDNPDYATLVWIVEAAKKAGRQITMVVTNDTPSTKKLAKTHKAADFGYTLSILPPSKHSVELTIS